MEFGNNKGFLDQPQKKKSFLSEEKSILFTSSWIVLMIMILAYVLFSWYGGKKENDLALIKSNQTSIEGKRDKNKEIVVNDFKKQLDTAGELLSQHIVWSEALDRLEKFINPRVQLKNLKADFKAGTLVFSAVGDNYSTVASQIASFYNDSMINNVETGQISQESGGRVTFDMTLSFDARKLLLGSKK